MLSSTESFTTLEHKLWDALSIIREQQVHFQDFHLVTYLLFLQKEGALDFFITTEPGRAKEDLRLSISRGDREKFELNRLIYDAFYPAIQYVSEHNFYDLLRLICSMDRDSLDIHFGDLVENLIFRLSKTEGQHGGEYVQPLELTRFICALASPYAGAEVYNPFGGLASFGLYFDKPVNYTGEEINMRSWAIGMIRLLGAGKASNSDFVVGNSIANWNRRSKRYDLIVANAPFNVKIRKDEANLLKYHRDGYSSIQPSYFDTFLINNSLAALKENGKAIFVLPSGFLTNKQPEYARLRQVLVENDFLETVISFPGGLLSNTNLPFCVIVLNKVKQDRSKILFIDAETSVKEVSKNDKRIDADRLLSIITNTDSSLSEASTTAFPEAKLVYIEEVVNNDFMLNVNRYITVELLEDLDGEYVELGKLLKPVKGSKIGDGLSGKLIRIRDLSNDKLDFEIKVNELVEVDLPKNASKLDKSALLITIRWKTLKPTFFEYKGEPIYVSPDVVAFEVNEQKVDVGFLVQELSTEYVTAQLNKYRTGTTIPYIPINDFIKVRVKVPALREQRAKIIGATFKTLEDERIGIKKEAYEELASIKHSMGTPLLKLNASVRNIESVLNKLDHEWQSVKMSSKSNQTLGDAVNSLYLNLKLISNLLKTNELELDKSTYPLAQFDAIQFFQRFVNELRANDKNKFEVRLEVSSDVEEDFKEGAFIKANEELLEIAFNNIVENAQKHAFVKDNEKYVLEFRLDLYLTQTSAYLYIQVANNGKAFPHNFNIEKLTRKGAVGGSTGNSGIGGYHINEIVKWHGGRLDLMTDPYLTFPFTTVYEIYIPISGSQGNNRYE
ncbi:N-6 DNA methylase [Rufibacter roseus]